MVQTPEDMDEASESAAASLKKLEARAELKPGIEAIRRWWAEHYGRSGHKRLARVILAKKID